MIDTKSIIAMRDEIENIQGGVGLSKNEQNQESFTEGDSPEPLAQRNITSDMFGPGGVSLGNAAQKACNKTLER
jgi:hypothetical protein